MTAVAVAVSIGVAVVWDLFVARDAVWQALVAVHDGTGTGDIPARDLELARALTGSPNAGTEEWLRAYLDMQRTSAAQMLTLVVALIVALVIMLGFAHREGRRQQAELAEARRLSFAITDAEERERERIARDLHDGVGQLLSLALLQAQSRAPGTADTISRSISDLRAIVHDLSVGSDDPLDLVNDLQSLAARYAGDSGAHIVVKCSGLDLIAGDARRNVHRIAQELLANAARHSHADHVTVSLFPVGDRLVLRYTDDGVGIGSLEGHPGHGLRNIRHRASVLGGSVRLVRRRPAEITIEIPTVEPGETTP
tara:strand:+ start:327 stop:1259 length:933 start_codon:yes stop_codon:yes gene_type:complete